MAFRFLLSGDRHFRKKGGDLVAFSLDRLAHKADRGSRRH
jgi:hypothetical protein